MINDKSLRDSPCVQEHIEGEPPQLEPLVRPVNEDTVNWHRPRSIHFSHCHCVVEEETQLQQKRRETLLKKKREYVSM